MRIKDRALKIQNRKGQSTLLNTDCQSFSFDEVHDLGEQTLGEKKPFNTRVALIKITPDPLIEHKKNKGLRGAKNGRNKANILHKVEAKQHNKVGGIEPEKVVLCYSKGMETVCAFYQKRWKIEILFRSLKTAGFRIEDTAVSDSKRIIFLMQAVMMSFALAFITGVLSNKIRKIPLKKHGYKAQTFVKRGLEEVQFFLQLYRGKRKKYICVKSVLSWVKPWLKKL